MSLEPIDNKNRPLRNSAFLRNEQMWEKTYTVGRDKALVDQINGIRHTIVSLLDHDCNLKRIVRMCDSTWLDPDIDFINEVFDHEVIDMQTWTEYRNYLIKLSMHIQLIQQVRDKINYIGEKFYESNRQTLKGN